MKTKVSSTGENEVELSVEVPAESVKKAYDRAVSKVREEMLLPGFRKGRVPVDLVIQNVGEDFIRGEALEDAIPEWGDAALKEAGLYDDAVGTSDLQVGPLDESKDYAFTLKVQTMPVPTLGEYKGLEVPKREVEITDEQISAQLAMLQERLASLQPVEDRAVQTGDFVLMDLSGSRDGEEIEGAQGKDQMYEVGRGNLIPGFEEELVGVKAGDEKSFDIVFPEDYHAEDLAGQPATFTVNVKEIKEKIVPELDDAFAADVSEFETMDDLRKDVRERLQAAATRARSASSAPSPSRRPSSTPHWPCRPRWSTVRRTASTISSRSAWASRASTMEVYLGVLQKTEEDIEEEMRPQAEFIIKRQLVLETIAEAEGLEVTDEDIAEVIKHDAEALGRDHLQLLADLEKSGRREALRDEMLVAKAADLVADASVAVPMTEAEEAAAEESADAVDPEAD